MSSAGSVAAKMAAVTKDLPIKMSSITKLERDGSSFQHWELDIMSYISFIPDVVMYFNGERMVDDDKYSQEWADVGDAIIHWSIDRDLARSLREIQSPFDGIEELRKQFSSVSLRGSSGYFRADFGESLRLDENAYRLVHQRDVKPTTRQVTTTRPMPAGLPDISIKFEASILAVSGHVVTTVRCKAFTG
ncbi:hypothetical protein CROQUDRAFT_97306 [Cronartium quercuum f. sp. fusiforme G11]|uniref:Uncharacterized protein n=1 Tax=Cronartium quercuum f. sp. fusiforme G11 TaxID=708437 RepID=A0A9P6T8H9_9BASI|nr:hypothetical protein CROQUDRAFT_97306 [Cronartium quercuum f. sp. fusiforme G11]